MQKVEQRSGQQQQKQQLGQLLGQPPAAVGGASAVQATSFTQLRQLVPEIDQVNQQRLQQRRLEEAEAEQREQAFQAQAAAMDKAFGMTAQDRLGGNDTPSFQYRSYWERIGQFSNEPFTVEQFDKHYARGRQRAPRQQQAAWGEAAAGARVGMGVGTGLGMGVGT